VLRTSQLDSRDCATYRHPQSEWQERFNIIVEITKEAQTISPPAESVLRVVI
jgi:hypothetical protein